MGGDIIVVTSCLKRADRGRFFCMVDCPAVSSSGTFRYVRVERPEDVPPRDERACEVVILDMNHGWPNLGHDSIVHAVRDLACDITEELQSGNMYIRALSYDVRRSGVVPEEPGERFSIYVGTGGPGHLDPRMNDGRSEGSQGIQEDPSWESGVFRLFDAVAESDSAALLAVCHTFGVLCRWSGIARPVLRGPGKGGKSSGIRENILTSDAEAHPWFRRFSRGLPDGRRLRIVDNRLYDLIPTGDEFPSGIVPLAYETENVGGPQGDALTMIELARDGKGVLPRMLAVNHHPEIVDRQQQLLILNEKWSRREVSREWFEEREKILTGGSVADDIEARIHHTAEFTLHGPLRFHVYRQLRLRADALGVSIPVHEDVVLRETAA